MSEYEVSDEDYITYSQGGCLFLAQAIVEKTGWTLCAVGTRKKGDIHHYLVQDNEGMFVDVFGRHDEDSLLDSWQVNLEVEGIYEPLFIISPDVEDIAFSSIFHDQDRYSNVEQVAQAVINDRF